MPGRIAPQSRLAKTTDIPQLAQLFYETVMRNAPQHYTEAQTQARASFALEERRFAQFLTEATTLLMEDGSGILGFAGLAADGHLNYPSFNGHTGCIIFLQ